MRLTLGLQSPLAFRKLDDTSDDWLNAPVVPIAIEFEGRTFVWHPPFEREDELRRNEYGPVVAMVIADDEDGRRAAPILQRFLSAIAYYFEQPVDDGGRGLGGDGGSDPFNPFGHRQQRAHPYIYKADRPQASPQFRIRMHRSRSRTSARASMQVVPSIDAWPTARARRGLWRR